MGKVVNINAERLAASAALRGIRNEYGLSVLQAAHALSTSAAAIERMERSDDPSVSAEEIRRQYELFAGCGGVVGKNLVFGHYPLGMARELLSLDIGQMAARYGYTVNSWKRIEADARPLRPELLQQIEEDVRDELATVCGDVGFRRKG